MEMCLVDLSTLTYRKFGVTNQNRSINCAIIMIDEDYFSFSTPCEIRKADNTASLNLLPTKEKDKRATIAENIIRRGNRTLFLKMLLWDAY